ncbi:MAG: serine/threonine protein kinase [Myxococcales bacterium]|nr:serine/threonine protein kinase [Myxococcales bacterium]
MGRVLVARDRRLGREVAVKETLVTSGRVARRFEREARITARLQHPAIVGIHEAGTWPTGEAFYAMRLVSGRSLDQAIAAAPTYPARLALLPSVLAVADAMAYAHGQRVIHRDLKPRNVVVGEFGETVVIDWGLAKELGHDEPLDATWPDGLDAAPTGGGGNSSQGSTGGETVAGEVLGTPAYMPPEQANGLAVDARADVYAIGAMLYHLLTGRAPYQADSTAELLSAVFAGPPPPLTTLAPEAARELVAIVERAMARDPAARYATARELAEDLRRFQTGQLVGAHRYSLRQLVRRWLRRHRTGLAALATAAAVAVVIGVVAIRRVVAAERTARAERAAAIAHQQDAEALMQFMLGDLREKLASVGKLDLLEVVARRAIAYYDARGDVGRDEDRFLAAVARLSVGTVIESRGDLPAALAEYRKAAATLAQLIAVAPKVDRYRERALAAELKIADALLSQGDSAAALASYQDLKARAEAWVADAPTLPAALKALALHRGRIAGVLEDRGELEAALAEYQASLVLAQRRAELDPSPDADKTLLIAYGHIGELLADVRHDVPGALAAYRTGLAIGERNLARDPKDPRWLNDVAISHDEIGKLLLDEGDPAAALVEFRAARATIAQAIAIDPTNTNPLDTSATITEKIGMALLAQDDLVGAAAEFTASAAAWDALAARDPSNLEWQRARTLLANKLGDVRLKSGDPRGALAAYQAALAIRAELVERDPTNASRRRDLFYSHYKVAGAYLAVPDRPAMIAALRAGIAVAQVTHDAHPDNETYANDVAETRTTLAEALREAGDVAGARAEFTAALAIAQRMAARPTPRPGWAKMIGEVTAALAALP